MAAVGQKRKATEVELSQDLAALVGEVNAKNRALHAEIDELRKKLSNSQLKKAEYVHDHQTENNELSKQVLDLQAKNSKLSKKLLDAQSAASTHLLGSVKFLNENLALTRRLNEALGEEM